MGLDKVILYYGFAPIADTDAVKLWQKTLCESLGIKGRIIVSPHGINGTLGGKMEDLKKYVKATKAYPGFKKIDFKWSDGTGSDFPKLKIKLRPELVAFGNPDEIKVDENGEPFGSMLEDIVLEKIAEHNAHPHQCGHYQRLKFFLAALHRKKKFNCVQIFQSMMMFYKTMVMR